jgi:hypothetical protein
VRAFCGIDWASDHHDIAAVDGGEGARKHPPVVVERAPRRDRVDRLVDKDW